MIKAEQVPETVAHAAEAAMLVQGTATWHQIIAAAINAWPGMFTYKYHDDTTTALILPLTENTND